jgi:aldehyde dehydrogenase (NAD+)
MRNIDQIYIDGAFVTPHGREQAELINPATEAVIGHVTLGDREDTLRAIAAAKRAWPAYARSTKSERIALLHRLHAAVLARADDINAATTEEYGGPVSRASWVARYAAEAFLLAAKTLEQYPFTRQIGSVLAPVQSRSAVPVEH